MRVVKRTDAKVTTPANAWLLSLLANTSIRLHGKAITIRIASKTAHVVQLQMLRVLLAERLASKPPSASAPIEGTFDLGDLGKLVVTLAEGLGDLEIEVDISELADRGPKRGLFKSMFDLHVPIQKVSFNDWRTSGPPKVKWVNHGLRVRFQFESVGNEATIGPMVHVFPVPVHVDGFRIDLHLVPYVFWAADVEPARDADGKPYNATVWHSPNKLWADLTHLYKQRCALFVDLDWDAVKPDAFGAAASLRKTAADLESAVEAAVPQELLFTAFEAVVLGERSLTSLLPGKGSGSPLAAKPSLLRGVDVRPNDARFLYFEESDEASTFQGTGRIVAVRKNRVHGHRNVAEDLPPDDIIEVELRTDTGERVRILTQNLVASILDGTADVEDVHVVVREGLQHAEFRRGPWGHVRADGAEWLDQVDRTRDLVAVASVLQYGLTDRDLLQYSGYLRSDPDADAANNLDNLSEYDYDWSDPLYRNLYDGTLFFEVPHYAGGSYTRDLTPRRWHLPDHDDRATRLVA